MNAKQIRNIKNEMERKEKSEEYIQKYITDYDFKKWFEGILTKNLEIILKKLRIRELHIWENKYDVHVISLDKPDTTYAE